MKILLVTSDYDYGALSFEEFATEEIKRKVWKEAFSQPNHKYSADASEIAETEEGLELDFTAYQFGEVDTKFIQFVRDEIQDYDDSKFTNFYEVEDE